MVVMKNTSKKSTTSHSDVRKKSTEHIGLVKRDVYLEPFEEAICGRHEHRTVGCSESGHPLPQPSI